MSDANQTQGAESGEILIRVTDLAVVRQRLSLVHNVSLSVSRGEIVTLIGPNGSGKSTTVKAILGIVKPSAGSVELAPGTRVGYVPQQLAINPTLPLTVERFMQLSHRHSARALQQALAMTGAAHLLTRDVARLSGGEFQRVLIARALAIRPDILVLDEPVQGVDYNAELEIYRLISQIRDQLNCGILLVSHDLHIVMAATDTVICLNGHVCCSGTPEAVGSSQAFRDIFGSRGTDALAIYRHRHDHHHGPDGSVIQHPAEPR